MLTKTVLTATLLLLLTACATPVPLPTATLSPTLTQTLAPTLTPSPTPTPLPAILKLHSPAEVSAVNPVHLEVLLVPPSSGSVTAKMIATVLTPSGEVYQRFNLRQQGELRYLSEQLLSMPLDPLPGKWRLVVGLSASRPVVGEQTLDFSPAPLAFYDLEPVLPDGVALRVPQAFEEVWAQGDKYAGGRVWRYGEGELALWWAPGPTEELLYDNALVLLESSHGADAPDGPEILAYELSEWQGQPAFRFQERWPGADGGPAVAWVVQGADHWLYVLRARAWGAEELPILLEELQATFELRE